MTMIENNVAILHIFLKVKSANLFLTERCLASALFLDNIASFWRWRRWLCCWAIFKAITAWSCNNSNALVKILEWHEIKIVNCLHLSVFKGFYPHNFERALKSMTCVQIESIRIDGFKNVKKIQNGTPLPW